jgi:hypothetical protein
MPRLIVLLFGGLLFSQAGCVFLVHGEKQMTVCESTYFNNIDGQEYTIIRHKNGVASEGLLTFNISGNCRIEYGKDLTHLGIDSMVITDARSANGAVVLLYSTTVDNRGNLYTCSAPLVEFETLEFLCPPELGGTSYQLVPQS